jgi:hypothetical protein
MERVYVTEFPDGTLIRWKPLSWSEYKELTRDYGHLAEKGAVVWLLFDAIGRLCVLDQQVGSKQVDYDDLYAGCIWLVAQKILEISGFINEPESIKSSLSAARGVIYGDWYEEIKGTIMSLFHISESEINDWSREKFLRHVVRAEILLGKEIPVESPEKVKSNENVKFVTDDHGNRIPVVTKQNMQNDSPIDFHGDNDALRSSELSKPDGEFNLKRLQNSPKSTTQGYEKGKHPARLKAERGEKIHPLRRKMLRQGMI